MVGEATRDAYKKKLAILAKEHNTKIHALVKKRSVWIKVRGEDRDKGRWYSSAINWARKKNGMVPFSMDASKPNNTLAPKATRKTPSAVLVKTPKRKKRAAKKTTKKKKPAAKRAAVKKKAKRATRRAAKKTTKTRKAVKKAPKKRVVKRKAAKKKATKKGKKAAKVGSSTELKYEANLKIMAKETGKKIDVFVKDSKYYLKMSKDKRDTHNWMTSAINWRRRSMGLKGWNKRALMKK